MKNSLLVVCLSLGLITSSFGQGKTKMEIRRGGTTEVVSGQTLEYTITTAEIPEIDNEYAYWDKMKFDVYNPMENDMAVRIKRMRIAVPNAWHDDLCWPPSCYNDVSSKEINGYYITPYSSSIPTPVIFSNTNKATIGTDPTHYTAEIKPQIYPKNVGSIATYRYYAVSTDGTVDYDSVTVKIAYVLDPNAKPGDNNKASISTLSASSLTISPNPTSEYVNVQAEGITQGIIRIVDVLGNVLYSNSFDTARKINVSDYKHGVYFISVYDASIKTLTKKLIIRE